METETSGITWLHIIGYVLIFFFITYPITLVLCILGKVEVNKLSKIKVINILSTSITIFIQQIKIIVLGYGISTAIAFMLFLIYILLGGVLTALGIFNPTGDLISLPVLVSMIIVHIIIQIVLYFRFIKDYIIVKKSTFTKDKMSNVAKEQSEKIDYLSIGAVKNYRNNKRIYQINQSIDNFLLNVSTDPKIINEKIPIEGNLFIPTTYETPGVYFNKNGNLWIKGRAIPLDGFSFFNKLIDWIEEFCHSNSNEVILNIELTNHNDSATKCMKQILIMLKNNCDNFKVNWYYEKHDEEINFLGKMLSESSGIDFNFIKL